MDKILLIIGAILAAISYSVPLSVFTLVGELGSSIERRVTFNLEAATHAHSFSIKFDSRANLPGAFSIGSRVLCASLHTNTSTMPRAPVTTQSGLTSFLSVLKFIAPCWIDNNSWTHHNQALSDKLAPLHAALANDITPPDLAGDILIEETINYLKSNPDFAASNKQSKSYISNSKSLEKAKSLKNKLRKAAKQSKDPNDQKAFYKALRTYNVLNRNRQKSDKLKCSKHQESLFQDNFWNFSKSVCNGTFGKEQTVPNFDQSIANQYYPGKYSVPQPLNNQALHWYPEITAPQHNFDLNPILPKHVRQIIKDKSNSSSPGPDGISYGILKKLPCLHHILATLYNKVLKTGIPPSMWAKSKITLIYKKGAATDPSNFRMIALASTFGKIFHQVMAQRTTEFMLRNNYIDPEIQKAFISKINGTIEHNQVLQEIIRHSKHNKKTAHITFFDLEDAFGSVSHDLISYSLSRYQFPPEIKNYISSLYTKLEGSVVTQQWQSRPFNFKKGIFQGDPWSPIIFLIVFNPLLEKLNELRNKGYNMNNINIITTPFADDFNLITSDKRQHQHIINNIQLWTTSMKLKLKPSKCISMSISCGKPVVNNFYLADENIATLENNNHKFLGSTLTFHGKQREIYDVVKTHLQTRLDRINSLLIRGEYKCKIYANYLLSASRFMLTIHTLSKTDLINLDALCHKYIKQWCNISHPGNTDIIHIDKFLNIPSIQELYDQCQISAYISSRIKGDNIVNAALDSRLSHEQQWTRKHSTTVACDKAFNSALAKSNINNNLPKHKAKEIVTKQAKKDTKSQYQKDHQQRLEGLEMQGELLRLCKATESDMCWQGAIYNLPKGLMAFILNSSLNTLPTMDNLKRWGKRLSNSCRHCGMPDYLSHVLSGCKISLDQGRYTYRHDSVLYVLHKLVTDITSSSPNIEVFTDLTGSNDQSPTIPPDIIPTPLRPDLVTINRETKTITIVELTVPFESNIQREHHYKTEKYQHLVSDLSLLGFTVSFFAIEIGCRGIITKENKNRLYNLHKHLAKAPPKSKDTKSLLKKLSVIASAASYAIFIARNYPNWIARDILKINC